jgi:excisionase family DNA binding protein
MNNYTKKCFLTPGEIAQKLRLNLVTIYSYIKKRKLKAIVFGRNYRIAQEDFEEFIESNKLR